MVNKRFQKNIAILGNIWGTIKYAVKFAWINYRFKIPYDEMIILIKKFKRKVKNDNKYSEWLKENELEIKHEKFEYNPFISVIIPHYNTSPKYLKECLDSILNQSYKNFEICIADDCSTNSDSIKILKKYEEMYSQIKIVYRKENGNISAATNSALEIAKGEFVAFMDSDDTLAKDALYYNVEALNKNKELDLIYSDEDFMDIGGNRITPKFKPDYSPNLLLLANYITHFVVVRTKFAKDLGGCRSEFDGAQDHEFLLRLTEITNNIYHIPKILYHWRMIPGSTALSEKEKPYVEKARKSAIEKTLERRKLNGKLIRTECESFFFHILFENNNEKVSILILDNSDDVSLEICINSIYEKTTYKNYEVILITYDTENELKNLEKYKSKYNNIKVINYDGEYNFSRFVNETVKSITGDFLVFMDSNINIVTINWIEYMLGYARQKNIGCVGAKILYTEEVYQAGLALTGDDRVFINVFEVVDEEVADKHYCSNVAGECSAVDFKFTMIDKKKFDEEKGLDEKLPIKFFDVDFCLKMLQRGYQNIYLPSAKVYYNEDNIKNEVLVESTKYMKEKWGKTLGKEIYARNDLFN